MKQNIEKVTLHLCFFFINDNLDESSFQEKSMHEVVFRIMMIDCTVRTCNFK